MIEREELEQLLSTGYESRGVELKGPGSSTDSRFLAKIARAGLSLGNLRDGGRVVIGIDDGNPAAMLPGLDDAQLASWLAYDDVARRLAVYADPPLRFDIAAIELSSGATVAVVDFREFIDLPHLCAKGYEGVLRQGALYVRTRTLPETAEVASSVEMRDVLDLATEKALRAFVERAERAGVRLSSPGPSADQRYREQRAEGWS